MRDLTTVAAEEQEIRGQLRGVSGAIATLETSLAGKCAEEHALLARLSELRDEATHAFDRTAAIAARLQPKAATGDPGAFTGVPLPLPLMSAGARFYDPESGAEVDRAEIQQGADRAAYVIDGADAAAVPTGRSGIF